MSVSAERDSLAARSLPRLTKVTSGARLANGAMAEVGMVVYFTAGGVKKLLDEMFNMTGAGSVGDLVYKTAGLFGQKIDSERVHAVTGRLEAQIEKLSNQPFVITAVSGLNRVDVRSGPPENRVFTDVPSASLTVRAGAFNFMSRVYKSIPIWGWSLIGLGVLGAGIATVHAVRKV